MIYRRVHRPPPRDWTHAIKSQDRIHRGHGEPALRLKENIGEPRQTHRLIPKKLLHLVLPNARSC